MLLKSTRTLKEMVPVLFNKDSDGPDPVYWVFASVSKKWENMTVIAPRSYDGEFPKTFGHYHSKDVVEKYKLLSGQGVLLMQKRKFIDDDWNPNQIEKIYFVEFLPRDEINITVEYGHSWSNTGDTPLVTLDNWTKGHTPEEYEPIKKLGGMAYYLVNKNGRAEFVANKNYKDIPKPEWISAAEFNKLNNGD